MQIAKKEGPFFVGFTNIQRFLIDGPDYQAQTGDLLEAFFFLVEYGTEDTTLIDGFGPDCKELNWRDMLPRVHLQSTATH